MRGVGRGKLWFDDILVRENGRFVLEELLFSFLFGVVIAHKSQVRKNTLVFDY